MNQAVTRSGGLACNKDLAKRRGGSRHMLSHVHLLMRTPRGQAQPSLPMVYLPDKTERPGAREMAQLVEYLLFL